MSETGTWASLVSTAKTPGKKKNEHLFECASFFFKAYSLLNRKFLYQAQIKFILFHGNAIVLTVQLIPQDMLFRFIYLDIIRFYLCLQFLNLLFQFQNFALQPAYSKAPKDNAIVFVWNLVGNF